MKIFTRVVVFSALALFLTSLWDKGFIIKTDILSFILLSCAVAVLHYIIRPFSKLILLPLNLVTFGIVSLTIYFVLFYFITVMFPIILITDWQFGGASLVLFHIPAMHISQLQNIALSSLSVSYIIGILERIL